MIEIEIPGYGKLELKFLVLDYNGTIALDGDPVPGLYEHLSGLSKDLEIFVVTADTHGTVKEKLRDFPLHVSVISGKNQNEAKLNFVRELGLKNCVAIGNGKNDRMMLEEAELGIATIQSEGAYGETVRSADIIVTNILDALSLLSSPLRLIATLRN